MNVCFLRRWVGILRICNVYQIQVCKCTMNVSFSSRWVGILRICKWTKYRLAACSALQWRVLNVIPLYSNFNNTTISLRQHAGLHRCDGMFSAQSFFVNPCNIDIHEIWKWWTDWMKRLSGVIDQVRWMGGASQFSCPLSQPPLPIPTPSSQRWNPHGNHPKLRSWSSWTVLSHLQLWGQDLWS